LIPCGLVVNELITNILKYGISHDDNENTRITIRLNKNGDDDINLIIRDNGIGLPHGKALSQFNGLGLKLVTTLVKQLDGTLKVSNEMGAKFEINFPQKIKFAGRG
jgi:two-component sensor histidine kinase